MPDHYPGKPKYASVEVGDKPTQEGHGRVRRAFCSPDALIERPSEGGIKTMADVLQFAVKKFTNKPVMGYRDTIKIHTEEKEITKTVEGKEVKETKKWQYYELSEYKYLTYTEFDGYVQDVSSGLTNLGLSHDTRFNIYASTCLNWQIMAHSCFAQNIPFCTAYDTLGEEGLQHSLNEPDVVGIFTNAHLLDVLANVIGETKTVKTVVYDGEAKPEQLEKLKKNAGDREGFKVVHFDEVRKQGKENTAERNPPKPDDVACIMYTSGSTGAPKGVILTHSNLIAAVGAVEKLLGPYLKPSDTFLAYLPLAHILEFIVECALTYVGVTMGYGSVKTLTSNSTKNCEGDLPTFKPSIMVGVPAVWETIRKGINQKVNSGPTVARMAFKAGYTLKQNKVPLLSNAADAVVFSKVRAQTGGRLRLTLSGGAALSKETQEFLQTALVDVLQGYGLTETVGMCAILIPDFLQSSCVGVPVPAVEVKLVDVPDAGYRAANNQGEIWIRGPAVSKGYFKREKETNEAFSEDGWFMSGDVGQWNKDGTLSIIDRKKNLVKLSGGEYIAIEKLESTYKSCDYVQNICVHADPDAKQPMALVFPREEAFRKLPGAGSGADLSNLCEKRELATAMLKELNAVGKNAGLKSLEQLQTVVLVPEDLPVTAAQKIQRKQAVDKYKEQVSLL
ncbi:acetyl-CoA synthetase-like protein [Acaromyces ingoldii]|uniref:Acetyl-CoA synthetase-like protein n=1 Tax=Acaromyces ingoldii TaxID=215250 RepID=A0A316YDU9_9BASI|nr:acetyl-CoA synthetase-like protein [Acaromyces ingoldii]PWN87587.1 acetyl-CoA synthetase-like protein [Acaromyces ingoldii]